MKGRVLVVEDDRSMVELLVSALRRREIEAVGVGSAAEALERLSGGEFEALVTDLNLGGMNGIELCHRVAEVRPDVPVLVITAFGSIDAAVQAIRAGAYDFLTKPFEMDALVLALERALSHRALQQEVRRLRRAVSRPRSYEQLVGESRPMRQLYDLLERVADTESSVLVTGESGTGKELVARALHQRSRRRDAPCVALNCAALPETLLESELFGHVRGAFTDARTGRAGLIQKASGGTLFLDEIGEMPLGLQARMLRALQERRVRPVGADDEIAVDIRLVAATNVDLEAAVDAGRFRQDLLYRIDVIRAELPPLRERGEDVLLLAQHFLELHAARTGKRVTGISSAVARRLLEHPWPGNVRELQNVIERAVTLTSFDQLTVDDLPPRMREARPVVGTPAADDDLLLPMEEVERRHILRVLDAVEGRKQQAAKILGLDRKTLYRKLLQYGVGTED